MDNLQHKENTQDPHLLIKVAIEATKDSYLPVKFTCPLCGNEASAIKSDYNGHVSVRCNTCNISMMM